MDRFITATLYYERIPIKFIVTSRAMKDFIDNEILFYRIKLKGHDREIFSNFIGEITKEVREKIKNDVYTYGISHYRGIPIEVDDTYNGFGLISKPWGE